MYIIIYTHTYTSLCLHGLLEAKCPGRKHWNCDWLSITLTWWISSARGGSPFCSTCQRSTMRKHRNVSRKLSERSAERLRCCPRIWVEELLRKPKRRRRLRIKRIDIRMREMIMITWHELQWYANNCSIPIWDLWEPQATSSQCFFVVGNQLPCRLIYPDVWNEWLNLQGRLFVVLNYVGMGG